MATPLVSSGSSHGLRQEDPLSHFLFIIFMEALSKMLSTTVDEGFLSGFSVGSWYSSVVNITHLLFGDNTPIFCGEILITIAIYLCAFLMF
jgi:hypothetical protein